MSAFVRAVKTQGNVLLAFKQKPTNHASTGNHKSWVHSEPQHDNGTRNQDSYCLLYTSRCV